MSPEWIAAGLSTVGILGYLMYSLLWPERF
jgi:K+-transporting ATPase KdpF subunit